MNLEQVYFREEFTLNYFDYAATTPLHPEAAHVYHKISQSCYGNTTSLHEVGAEAQNMLAYCRTQFAGILGVEPAGIYFTSGGTESNLLSIISLAKANRHKGNHIVTTLGEHPSIDSALEYLKEDGFLITKIPFTKRGTVNLDLLMNALTDKTILVSVQHSNPEIGTIQPLEKIGEITKKRGILLHSDCVQSFGKIDIKPIAKIVDSLTLSGHKIYGPKGIGIAYIHPRHRVVPVFPGLVHESGFRGGTVNVPAIAALAMAGKLVEEPEATANLFRGYRASFIAKISQYPDLFTLYDYSEEAKQLPHIIGLRVHNVEGQLMMLELNRHGFAVSTGSACQVGQQTSSKAMMALQLKPQKAREFIRISFGQSTTADNVKALADSLVLITRELDRNKTMDGTL